MNLKPFFCSARLTTMTERKADSRVEIVVVPHYSSEKVERAKCDAGGREKNFSLSPPRVAFSRVEWFSRALAFRSPYNGGLLVVYFWKKERSAKRANFTWLRPNYQLLKHNQSNEKKKKHVTAKSEPTNSREIHEPRLIVAVLSSEKKTVKIIFWIDSTGRIYSWISDFAMNILPAEFGFLEHSFSRMTKSQYHNNMQNSCTKKWET